MSAPLRFVQELRRRKVLRTGAAYLVMAFVTLQVVDAVFPALPLPAGADTLVVVLLVLGFPIALVLAWTLELTPSGLRRELPDERAAAAAERSATLRAAGAELPVDAIAVLPFRNLSPDPETEYFSDGVTEDVIASVARIRGVRVLSRTSVLQYKETTRPLLDIALELGVGTVVTGSVRRSGGRVRIVAQVVDAREEGHLWTETYDRDLGDVFQIQSEVAAQVAAAVRRELTASERSGIAARGTTDPEAYDLYLRARALWGQRDEATVTESLTYFRRALERDAHFAAAYAGVADAYTVLGIYGARAPEEVCPAATDAAYKALETDPGSGEAMASLACITAVFSWEWERAEELFHRAVEMSPSYATAHQWYAVTVLTPQARFEEALAALERARELDPASPAIAATHGIIRLYARDYDAALAGLERVRASHPSFGLARYFLGQCHDAMGRLEDAAHELAEAVRLGRASSEMLAVHGHVLARLGRTAEAEGVLQRLEDRSRRTYVSPAL
ncbi:MAG TPA: tetratricopeptide repeat protein, partial [Longimicrobiales bacterium]|nr:tetratricopeptide repeat protein [Longimicrobiales bacterium]